MCVCVCVVHVCVFVCVSAVCVWHLSVSRLICEQSGYNGHKPLLHTHR